jgi:hypothetical protein
MVRETYQSFMVKYDRGPPRPNSGITYALKEGVRINRSKGQDVTGKRTTQTIGFAYKDIPTTLAVAYYMQENHTSMPVKESHLKLYDLMANEVEFWKLFKCGPHTHAILKHIKKHVVERLNSAATEMSDAARVAEDDEMIGLTAEKEEASALFNRLVADLAVCQRAAETNALLLSEWRADRLTCASTFSEEQLEDDAVISTALKSERATRETLRLKVEEFHALLEEQANGSSESSNLFDESLRQNTAACRDASNALKAAGVELAALRLTAATRKTSFLEENMRLGDLISQHGDASMKHSDRCSLMQSEVDRASFELQRLEEAIGRATGRAASPSGTRTLLQASSATDLAVDPAVDPVAVPAVDPVAVPAVDPVADPIATDVDTHSEWNNCETESETGSESEMVSSLCLLHKKRGREA